MEAQKNLKNLKNCLHRIRVANLNVIDSKNVVHWNGKTFKQKKLTMKFRHIASEYVQYQFL